MPDTYIPPFTMTDEITNLVIEIAELTGAMTVSEQLSKNPKLKRGNRIKSIHSSLAIEQNRLTVEQVSDVIDGKRVLGSPQDIREAKNAYEAYEAMTRLNPYSVKDLLKAHKIMMEGLVKEAGIFRSKGVGVYAGNQLIHAGTPANYVPDLVGQLFDWLKKSKLHPLVKGCIFHYEFEFIHPFADGNGRTGRLWHTLILAKWQEFFLWIPIETIIHERQEDYYKALNASNAEGESTIFVQFMLELIRELLKELSYNGTMNKEKKLDEKLLDLLKEDGNQSAAGLAEMVGTSQRTVQRALKRLMDDGKIEHVGSNRFGHYVIK
ncbi:Fic family protein [Lachnoclostridium sp. Marseille-P6806]|uniref:Fic family protein n=1 Tax=Lachnoclostridium sp. Marseille-P6806 TaxID=2364793 RepID=UPI001030FDEA|nr:Fic family protein [Lachnoclostridium sp. Marseille-P6806]